MNPNPSLQQLHDIHLPAAVGPWPPAPGWWLLALLLASALGAGLWWLWRRWRSNRYRRQALQRLRRYRARFHRDQDQAALLSALSQLLRRTALSAYPRPTVAGLSGDAWRAFLRAQSGLAEFDTPLGDALVHGPYRPQPTVDAGAVVALAERWIKRHRRPPC